MFACGRLGSSKRVKHEWIKNADTHPFSFSNLLSAHSEYVFISFPCHTGVKYQMSCQALTISYYNLI